MTPEQSKKLEEIRKRNDDDGYWEEAEQDVPLLLSRIDELEKLERDYAAALVSLNERHELEEAVNKYKE